MPASRGHPIRLGILGGSFDPIHLGHLRSAEEVREALRLDRVVFVPAGNPPHKPDRRLAPRTARLRMVELAVAGNPAFRASPLEVRRAGVTYSIDTIAALRRALPRAALFFIMGLDAFRELHTWRDLERIFELASLVVTNRPPAPLEPSIDHLPIAARKSFCYSPRTQSYRHPSGNEILFLSITGLDVSATAIRERRAAGRSIRYLVPDRVDRFIRDRRLYRGASSA